MGDKHLRRLGARVRQLRLGRNWTLAELGRRSGMHPAYLRSVEDGQRPVSTENLTLLAETFGLTVHELLEPVLTDPDGDTVTGPAATGDYPPLPGDPDGDGQHPDGHQPR